MKIEFKKFRLEKSDIFARKKTRAKTSILVQMNLTYFASLILLFYQIEPVKERYLRCVCDNLDETRRNQAKT